MALYLLPSLLLLMTKASAQPNFISHLCLYKTGNFIPNSTFKANLDHVLSSVTTNGKLENGFYRFSYGQNSDRANAVGLCRPEIKLDACQSCLNDSVRLLTKRCPNQKEAIGWYENCFLHYSSSSLSNQMHISPMFRTQSTKNATNTDQFIRNLRILLNSLKNKASLGDHGSLHKYAAGNMSSSELETTYALVQCLPDLTPQQCDDCLSSIFKKLPSCCSQSAGIFTPSCLVNYKPTRFFDSVTDDGPTTSSTVHKSRAVGMFLSFCLSSQSSVNSGPNSGFCRQKEWEEQSSYCDHNGFVSSFLLDFDNLHLHVSAIQED
ncbi:cysteine-rich receptor-like protein kinase 26 isoform X1 [Cucumis melo var. makuwa]|uniref:Cysteine-rich receptor-like protein kinase 26 n=2 Tax=Cucumis melo TaxID=3656 RepID=A0A9I9CRL6_CUCME|nr:cysteine-rich receptor-like protein kinase 26 [Cucumis melo]KAA0052748.1 cysteine-rich receptor-like protein kinase 26 isoform X1 [Cucumis melo var. makuwa]